MQGQTFFIWVKTRVGGGGRRRRGRDKFSHEESKKGKQRKGTQTQTASLLYREASQPGFTLAHTDTKERNTFLTYSYPYTYEQCKQWLHQ